MKQTTNIPIKKFFDEKLTQPFHFSHHLGKELLIDTSNIIAGNAWYARDDGLNPPYYQKLSNYSKIYLRKSVVEKLQKINQKLKKHSLELYLLDGWRSINTQAQLWEFFIKSAYTQSSNANKEEAEKIAAQFCSNPSLFDPQKPETSPPHATGGAVDLTLRNFKTKEHLFMGGIFDDPSEISFTRFFEDKENLNPSSIEARNNRRIIYHLMIEEDFTPHPCEWWHFDFGNFRWAKNKKTKAFYGYIEP